MESKWELTPNDGHNRPYRQHGLGIGNRIVAVGSGLMRRLGVMWGDGYECARDEAIQDQWEEDEKFADDLERMSRLFHEASYEFADEGRSRRFRSLYRRATEVQDRWAFRLDQCR